MIDIKAEFKLYDSEFEPILSVMQVFSVRSGV